MVLQAEATSVVRKLILIISSPKSATITGVINLIAFLDNPPRTHAAGLTSLKSEVTLVEDLLVGDVIRVTFGYALPNYWNLKVKVNSVVHSATIKSGILEIGFTGLVGTTTKIA